MNQACEWCGKDFRMGWGAKRYGARFCNDECRNKYNNELKRQRKQKPLLEAEILRARDNLTRGGNLQQEALDTIRAVMSLAHHQILIKCANCGQKRFEIPLKNEECTFCHKKEWKFEPKYPETLEDESVES